MTTTRANSTASTTATFTIGGDFTINRMGFGAMRITGQGIWGEPADRPECIRVLRRAVEVGINFIDTADAYGPDVSENIIAEALYPYPDGLVIGTKGGLERSGPGLWNPNGRPEHLKQALEGSLRRLRLERIDLYQFHRPDPDVPLEESVGALAEMQREGKIRHLGVSNFDTGQLATAQRITSVVSVQNRYNLTDRSSESVLQECTRQGLAFIPWGPLAAGSVYGESGPVSAIAERHGATSGQIALAWELQHSPSMVVIPGTSKVSHLDENAAAADIRLSEEEMETLDHLAG